MDVQKAARSLAAKAGTRLNPALGHALQPIIDVHNGVVYAYEALVRGTDAAGHLSIDAFFDAAFAEGALMETEFALYERAFATFRRVPRNANRKLFLNIDNRIFADPRFDPEIIGRTAERLGVQRSAVCLELSEKHETGIGTEPVSIVRAMRDAGLRIALDDFGQGFSELKLFYESTPEYVKIDRFFISGIATSPRKRLFVSTVVNLAHVLGARVVAEGVETEEEFVACRQIGCDLAQGWYIARPFRDPASAPSIYMLAGLDMRGTVRAADSMLVEEMQSIEPLKHNATLDDVFQRFQSSPEQSVFPVVDASGEPLGLFAERDFRSYGYSNFGRDLLSNRILNSDLKRFLVKAPVVEIDADVEHMLDSVATYGEADGVIVTRDMIYAGMLSPASLVRILNEKRLSAAQEQNPLTRIPGNSAVSRFIAQAAEMTCSARAVCYFDFNHFKPFNDTYGFRQGDRAIILFADILRREMDLPGVFIGHIGGDDFFAGYCGADLDGFEIRARRVLEFFKADIVSFYEQADRERGYLIALDREGDERMYPMMTCAAAIIKVPRGLAISDVEDFTRQIAETKRRAKMEPGAIFCRIMR